MLGSCATRPGTAELALNFMASPPWSSVDPARQSAVLELSNEQKLTRKCKTLAFFQNISLIRLWVIQECWSFLYRFSEWPTLWVSWKIVENQKNQRPKEWNFSVTIFVNIHSTNVSRNMCRKFSEKWINLCSKAPDPARLFMPRPSTTKRSFTLIEVILISNWGRWPLRPLIMLIL